MKRRDSIKTILLSAIGTSITLESCITPEGENIANKVWEYQYGRTAYEKSRDEKFLNSVFFNDNELSTIEKIANIIVPPNKFGDIKDAGVVEMIEFIAKDWSTPAHNNYGENVLRKGLTVLDELFQKEFLNVRRMRLKQFLIKFPIKIMLAMNFQKLQAFLQHTDTLL